MVKAKQRYTAASVVSSMLNRAEDRIRTQFAEKTHALKDKVIAENKDLVAKYTKAAAALGLVVKELSKVGLSPYNNSKDDFFLSNTISQKLSVPLAKERDAKLAKLEKLSLDVALLGVAADADLQAQTRSLLEKIESVVGEE